MYKCPLILLSPLWQMPLWHQVANATAILSGIISLCISVVLTLLDVAAETFTVLDTQIHLLTACERTPYVGCYTVNQIPVRNPMLVPCIFGLSPLPTDQRHMYRQSKDSISLTSMLCHMCGFVMVVDAPSNIINTIDTISFTPSCLHT